jgi:hypothetical protein
VLRPLRPARIAVIGVSGVALVASPAVAGTQLQPDACTVLTENAYARARAKAQFDGMNIENVRGVAHRAYWLSRTNNFERTVVGEQLVCGELTALDGRRVYSVFVAPPSIAKARAAMQLVSGD